MGTEREGGRHGWIFYGLSRAGVLWGGTSGLPMQKRRKLPWFPSMAGGVPPLKHGPSTPQPCFPVAAKLRALQYCKVVITDVEMPALYGRRSANIR